MLIPKGILPAIVGHAAKDKTRYALNGFLLERRVNGPRAVATDGRRLICVRWSEEPIEEWPMEPGGGAAALVREQVDGWKRLIPLDAAKELDALAPKNGRHAILRNVMAEETEVRPAEGDYVRFAGTDLEKWRTTKVRELEGTYPDYDAVIPTDPPKAEIVVNAGYLVDACNALAALRGDKDTPVRIQFREKGEPVVLLHGTAHADAAEGTVVLMPINLDV